MALSFWRNRTICATKNTRQYTHHRIMVKYPVLDSGWFLENMSPVNAHFTTPSKLAPLTSVYISSLGFDTVIGGKRWLKLMTTANTDDQVTCYCSYWWVDWSAPFMASHIISFLLSFNCPPDKFYYWFNYNEPCLVSHSISRCIRFANCILRNSKWCLKKL